MNVRDNNQCAGYIGEITLQLANMARRNNLPLLAYLLDMAALAADSASDFPPVARFENTMTLADSVSLREQAHRCTRLARRCPDVPTAHELEAIGVELMLTAAEFDKVLADGVMAK
jgi:hypothetical protein